MCAGEEASHTACDRERVPEAVAFGEPRGEHGGGSKCFDRVTAWHAEARSREGVIRPGTKHIMSVGGSRALAPHKQLDPLCNDPCNCRRRDEPARDPLIPTSPNRNGHDEPERPISHGPEGTPPIG